MKTLLRVAAITALLFLVVGRVSAQSFDEAYWKRQEQEILKQIEEAKLRKDTLSKQITLFDSQIKLTTLQIDDKKRKIIVLDKEIQELGSEIDRLEVLKTKRLELVLHRIPQSYKRTASSQFGWILLSNNFSDLFTRVKYLLQVQEEDTKFYKQLQLTQMDYNDRKDVRENKKVEQETLKKQLEKHTIDLAKQKKQQQAFLADTQNDEARYQRLLSQARAQMAGFAKFSSSQGGGVLSGQTRCDGWGCYYNQRDSQWGYTLINGSNDCGGPCNVMRVGCLITSVAMVASHYGRNDISPGDIAVSDPSNFSVGTALLKKSISVKGKNISRVSVSSTLNPDVVKDGPMIVGVYYGEFGTHFVVVKSYQDGKYVMDDPYRENGRDVSFTDHYSLGSVFSVEKVSM